MNQITIPTTWTKTTYNEFILELNKLIDKDYLEFNKKLIFTNYKMLGIRIPLLRKISSKIKTTSIEDYLNVSTPKTYEEIFIRGIIISYIKDYNLFLKYFHDYLDYIDNWAICDMVLSSLKIINKNKDIFLKEIERLLVSDKEFYIRVGLISLLDYYVEKEYLPIIFDYINNIKNNAYYVHMGIAWLVSELYIKYPSETEVFLKNNNLNKEIQNKSIQKIRESTRVSKETKDYLLKYKHWQNNDYII